MANRGLKPYTKQLEFNIGRIKVYINLSKRDKNVIFYIPFFKTDYPFSMDIGIIHNSLYNSATNVGYQNKLNIKRANYISSNYIEIENEDFSIDRYDINTADAKYYNYETASYIEIDSSTGYYVLHDNLGFTYEFETTGYPYFIKSPNNKEIEIQSTSLENNITLTNYGYIKSKIVSPYPQDHNSFEYKITSFSIEESVGLEYDSYGNITSLTIVSKDNSQETYSISYGTNTLTIESDNDKEKLEIEEEYESSVISKIYIRKYSKSNSIYTQYEQTIINYLTDTKTRVNDNYGNQTFYFFYPKFISSNVGAIYLPLYYIDNTYDAYNVYYKTNDTNGYNNNNFTKLLDHVSAKVSRTTLTSESLLPNKGIDYFSGSGLSINLYNEPEFLYTYLLNTTSTNRIYQLQGTGYISYQMSVEAFGQLPFYGVKDDNYLFSMYVKNISVSSNSNVTVRLTYGSSYKECELRKTNVDGEYELLTIGIHLDSSITSIEVKISLTNANIAVGGLILSKKDFGIYYENYDSKNRSKRTVDISGKTLYEYSYTTGKITKITYPSGEVLSMSYDYYANYNLSSITNNYGYMQNNTYNSTSYVQLTKVLSSTSTSLKIKTENSLTSDLNESNNYDVRKVIDELGSVTKLNYTGYHKVNRTIYPNSVYEDRTYDSYRFLHQITKASTGIIYSHSEKYITEITSANSSLITYIYNEKNLLSSAKINNTTFKKLTYNTNSLVTKIEYGTNSDSFEFTYSSYNPLYLEEIKYRLNNTLYNKYKYTYNNYMDLDKVEMYDSSATLPYILKAYEYDNERKTTRIYSNYLGYSYEYKYENDNDVLIKSYNVANVKNHYLRHVLYKTINNSVINNIPATLSNYEIIPFDGSIISLKGKKPIIYNTDLVKYVRYKNDETLNRDVLYFTSSTLAYDFGITNSATIHFKIKLTNLTGIKYLISQKDNSNSISLCINSSTLRINVNGTEISTTLSLVTNEWYTIVFNYKVENGVLTYNLKKDDTVRSGTYSLGFSFGNVKTYIGTRYDNAYMMSAYLCDLAVINTYDVNNNTTLKNKLNTISSKTISFDNLRRTNKVKITNGLNTILTNEYNYINQTGSSVYTSNRVSSEIIKYGNTSFTRTYSYDNMGRVISITNNSSLFGDASYTYDNRGYLSSETINGNTISYEYDNNGNMTSATYNGNTKYFAYDSTIKDRLQSYDGSLITYPTNSPLNPNKIGEWNLTFEGRRLVKALREDAYMLEEVKYKYDDEGHLIKREYYSYSYEDEEETSSYINYYWENDNMISEVTSSGIKTDFLYDENNSIYGFIRNNTNKYYYIKDVLNNVIGIVDENGSIVTRYLYSAYGEYRYQYGSSIYNPIRYKGYYFDSLVNIYYCKTRFYSPEIKRWINADGLDYLDTNTPGCVNLFIYCNNNPVMYFDGDGHMPKWLKWTIGFGIITACAIATVVTGGAAASTLLAGVHTIAYGALLGSSISAGIGMVAGGFSLTGDGISWNSNNAATGFMLGAISGVISGGVSAGTGVAGLAPESYLSRGIMAGTDSILGLGTYFTQNAINETMNNITFVGAALSFSGGLLNFTTPVNKYFDAFWIPTIAAEIGWGCDNIITAARKKKLLYNY